MNFLKILAIFAVFSLVLAQNDDFQDLPPANDEFSRVVEDLVLINFHIDSTKDENSKLLLQDSKNKELQKITLKTLLSAPKFSIQDLRARQNTLQAEILNELNEKISMQKFIQIQEINLLILMQNFISKVREQNFHKHRRDELLALISETQNELKNTPDFAKSAATKHYEATKAAQLEILNFLHNSPEILLTSGFFDSFDTSVSEVLYFIERGFSATKILIFSEHSEILAKFFLSAAILIFLLTLRKLCAEMIFVAINFLMRAGFSTNESTQRQIKKDITRPITYVLLFFGLNIALLVAFHPLKIPQFLRLFFGALYILNVAFLAIIMLKSYGALLMDKFLAQKHGFRREVINLILKIGYFFIFVIALLFLLHFLGFNIQAVIASLGIGGIAVALALKDMLANFFASVMLLFENSFSQGDWIVCAGVEGTVVEMGLRRTLVRTFDNALVFVPNSALANASILNWNRRKVGRRIKMLVGLTYDTSVSDLQRCITDIRAMLHAHPDISKKTAENEPEKTDYELSARENIVSVQDLLGYKYNLFVVLDSFGDSSINILIYCFSRSVVWGEFLDIKQNVMLKIMEIVEKNGLSFAFPSTSLYVESLPKNPVIDLSPQNPAPDPKK